MKRCLRFRLTLLLLLVAAATTTFLFLLKPLLLHSSDPNSTGFAPSSTAALTSTFLRLASSDPADAELVKQVQSLLDSSFPSSASSYRLEDHSDELRDSPHFHHLIRRWLSDKTRKHCSGVMADLLSLIKPHIDRAFGYPPTAAPYATCAVVGNSGILLNSNHGDLIDGHDIVIRLNNAPIAGHRSDVGWKTSLSLINGNVLHLCAREKGCLCHPYRDFVPVLTYICQASNFVDYLACNASQRSSLLLTDVRLDALCSRIVKYYSLKRFTEETGRPPEEWREMHDERKFHYSSGMQAVMLAAGFCRRVSVFGFGKKQNVKHHYHTNRKAELDMHDYPAEYAFYRDLADRPAAVPFLRDEGFKVPPVVFYV